MSASGLNYMIRNLLESNKKLAAYYDFADFNGEVDPVSPNPYTGVFYNQFPAYDTGKYRIDVLSATGSSEVASEALLTGATSGAARMTQSNLRIPVHELQVDNMSAVIDFEWDGAVTNGVILGSFTKFMETLGPTSVTGAKGWNLGVDDRGGLFFQSFSPNGAAVFSTTGIELSKRNVVGVSVYNNEVILSQFDYFNDVAYQESANVKEDYLAQPDYFYVGGSPEYFNTTLPSDVSFSGTIHELALFSGSLSPNTLKKMGSGILGDYFYNTGGLTTKEVVTGYDETITYKTGVTGVTLEEAGTLTVTTGRHSYTGYLPIDPPAFGSEGDDSYIYYNYDNGSFKTVYKEKIGHLEPSNNFTYSPTGENAFDTLGLQSGTFSIGGNVSLTLSESLSTGSYSIYQQVEQTGILGEISGVVNIPLTQTVTGYNPASSGINFNIQGAAFKRDYIYYEGERL